MDQQAVFDLLEQNKNQRGIDNWEKMSDTGGLTSYGMGLTVHRKLAKKNWPQPRAGLVPVANEQLRR